MRVRLEFVVAFFLFHIPLILLMIPNDFSLLYLICARPFLRLYPTAAIIIDIVSCRSLPLC